MTRRPYGSVAPEVLRLADGILTANEISAKLGVSPSHVREIVQRKNKQFRGTYFHLKPHVNTPEPKTVQIHLTSELFQWLKRNTPPGAEVGDLIRAYLNDAMNEDQQ